MSFYREALAIALPVMLQQLIMSMVSLIDNFMVAGLGDISMAAVNVTNQLNFIFFVIINTICQAGGIYVAQFKGADDPEGMRQAFRFKIIFAVITAALYFTLCWTIPHFLSFSIPSARRGAYMLRSSRARMIRKGCGRLFVLK